MHKTEDIVAFSAVVQHGSVSAAAQVLGVTQPVITRRIQSLEESLGVTLLERHTKPLKPSTLGRAVYERCLSVLDNLDALTALAADHTQPSGLLRIGTPYAFSNTTLGAALHTTTQQFPSLRICHSLNWSAALVEQVESQELDAAVLCSPENEEPHTSAHITPLGGATLVPVAHRGELHRSSYRLADLAERGWILNPRECGVRSHLQSTLIERGLPFNLQFNVLGLDLQLHLVAQGHGLGLVPEHLYPASPYAAQIKQLTVTDFTLRQRLWLITARQATPLQQAALSFARSIQAEVNGL